MNLKYIKKGKLCRKIIDLDILNPFAARSWETSAFAKNVHLSLHEHIYTIHVQLQELSRGFFLLLFLYFQLTISFMGTLNFWYQGLRHHLAADCTIIMSWTLKAMGNHVMYEHSAWFLRVSHFKFSPSVLLAVCIFLHI